jgi:hypothetical protein
MEATDPSSATTNPVSPVQTPSYLDRSEGRVAYEVAGDGPLVVLVPGMGDLSSAYRFLAPLFWMPSIGSLPQTCAVTAIAIPPLVPMATPRRLVTSSL